MFDKIRVSEADLQRNIGFLVTFLHQKFPTGNYTEGTVLHDLVIRPMASILSLLEGEIGSLESRNTVKGIMEEESESSTALLDLLASNFFIGRRKGERSQGVVTLRLSTADTVVIPPGTIFTKSLGIDFIYDAAENLVIDIPEVEYTSDGIASGYYLAKVFVSGITEYIGSGMPPGILQSMTNSPIGLDTLYNEATFSIAEGQEPNLVFAERIKEAVSNRSFNTEHGIRTVLTDAVNSVRKVQVIGAGDPEMMRDYLAVGASESIHTLGKINIFVDTGWSVSRETLGVTSDLPIAALFLRDSATGNFLGIKSVFSGVTLYGESEVSALAADDAARVALEESSDIALTYTDYLLSNTSTESIAFTVGAGVSAAFPTISLEAVTPKANTIVDAYISSEGLRPAGSDIQTYYPHVKNITIKIAYVRNPNVAQGDMPLPMILQGVVDYVNSLDAMYSHLSVSGLLAYVSKEFSYFFTAINSNLLEVKYKVLLPDGNMPSFKVVTDTSFSNSTSYYNRLSRLGTELKSEEVTGHITLEYLNSLQVGDSTCSLYVDPSSVVLEEI